MSLPLESGDIQPEQVGKQRLATKQYNSPMAMYSEDILEEIMQQVNQIWILCKGRDI